MSNKHLHISLEFTPNPNTLKYAVNRILLPGGALQFLRQEEAINTSPLAHKLLGTPGIASVMIGRDFVTVTKSADGNWDEVHQHAQRILEAHLGANEPVVLESAATKPSDAGSEVERKIIEIIENEIRPAVAMDGGDVQFERFENGVVYLFMQGACSGCPSAKMTLKMGIETRLREAVPEVNEVVSING